MAEEEAEVLAEVEAVRAVYGDDCLVLRELRPSLAVHMRPRTADVSSEQFVEAVIRIEAGPQYPVEVPCIKIIDSKGLDDQRQEHLIAGIRAKAQELLSCFMFVALCEEAVEILSNMNHPVGNCPLCLDPLFPEDQEDAAMPFMKLMSCFHCFHSECIVRWWKWLQEQNKNNLSHDLGSSGAPQVQRGGDISASQPLANCPVCRQKFDSKDIEHVLSFMGTNPPPISESGSVSDDMKEFLQSDEEKNRRQKFEALLELQKGKRGLIEPQKIKAIMPGMFLSEPPSRPTSSASIGDQAEDTPANVALADMPSKNSSIKPGSSAQKNADPRRNRAHQYHHHPSYRRNERNIQSNCKWIQKGNSMSRQ